MVISEIPPYQIGDELRDAADMWMPHSVLLSPAQRPDRGSCPGSKPGRSRACSRPTGSRRLPDGWRGSPRLSNSASIRSRDQDASGLTLILPSTSSSTADKAARVEAWKRLRPVIQASKPLSAGLSGTVLRTWQQASGWKLPQQALRVGGLQLDRIGFGALCGHRSARDCLIRVSR